MTAPAIDPGSPAWALGAFVVTVCLAGGVRALAAPLGLVARPNARSSHVVPTPTGGGIAIVFAVLAWFVLAWWHDPAALPAPPLAVGGILVAAVGLMDDVRDLGRGIRLACHLAAALVCVLWLFDLPVHLAAVLVLALMWFVNLYNFMDGIDGLAASQGAAFALGALILGGGDSATLLLVMLAACTGFLCLNWAPATIFMGDVGSGFLGLVFGVLVAWMAASGEMSLAAGFILLAAFWFDATWTLCVRIATGQRFMEAHRSHLYQVLSRRFGHGGATALFWGYWLLWLLPLATVAERLPGWGPAALAAACVPLAAACLGLGAGRAN